MTNNEAIEIIRKATPDALPFMDKETELLIMATDKAIEALEKHSLKKPIWQGDAMCPEPYCPNCGEYLDDGEEICDECTQLIDWSIGWCDDEK